jgi:hypothetical protein
MISMILSNRGISKDMPNPRETAISTVSCAATARLVPYMAELLVTSDPPGARVLVNNVFVAVTPADLTTRIGIGRPFTLSVRKSGHRRWTRRSIIRPGRSRYHARMEKTAP